MSLDIDIADEVKEIIQNSLDANLVVFKHEDKTFLSVDLLWDGKTFAGRDIDIDNILNKEESE